MTQQNNLQQLQKLLWQLFQIDKAAELDFGLYRIMNYKREEISDFIVKTLPEIVEKEFASSVKGITANQQENFEEQEEKLRQIATDAGLPVESLPKWKELQEQKQQASNKWISLDADHIQQEIYDYIYKFFKRYFQDGDFYSKKRYSTKSKYTLDYNGEETYFHWTNKDQYYIKTGENFSNYAFKPKDAVDYSIQFKIQEAEVETNNNKADAKRYFILAQEGHTITDSQADFFFEYRALTADEEKIYGKKNIQDALNESAYNTILKLITDKNIVAYLTQKATETKDVLQKHLNRYSAKNSEDYFIHKDIKGFLRKELDFYIKNEVLYLDDLGLEDGKHFERNYQLLMTMIVVIKKVSFLIIDFVAQLEDYQKKLFEKKKFIYDSNYILSLAHIDSNFWDEIISNEEQVREWKDLWMIDENQKIDTDFLQGQPTLTVDTKFFSNEWKWKVLGQIEDIDEKTTGTLINSENFQALNLLQGKYKEQIKCIYIDPPYNTGWDGFIYKDWYQHSSWLSLMQDRLAQARELMSDDGVIFSSIDDKEVEKLKTLKSNTFWEQNFIANLIWNTEGHTDNQYQIKINAEYILMFGKEKEVINLGYVIDPNTRKESNLWKWFAENSITKNGKANPYSTVLLPSGFPCISDDSLFLEKTNIDESFFQEIEKVWYIDRDITKKYEVEYPIRIDDMHIEKWKLQKECKVMSWWANVNKLKTFIEKWCKPFSDADGNMVQFYLSKKWVIYYKKERDKARNIVSVLKNMGTTEQQKYNLESMGVNWFSYPKPSKLIEYLVEVSSEYQANLYILDFFAGSGTTGQAVMNLNKADQWNRKFLLVEMGEYFESVLMKRTKKVMYSDNWKNGKATDNDWHSQIVKYFSLEQYEDTLNNLSLTNTINESSFLTTQEEKTHFMLNYMLDLEGKKSLFNLKMFERPFHHTMKITINGEMREKNIDLVETFNYLTGLSVQTVKHWDNGVLSLTGTIQQETKSEKVLVVWRDMTSMSQEDFTAFYDETLKGDYDTVYINWQTYNIPEAQLIEEVFYHTMVR